MPKTQNALTHPYKNPQSFERLMLLIATLIKYPGVGHQEIELFERNASPHHDALQEVQQYMQKLAASLNISLPDNYPATPTLRKDLENLRNYHILEQRMYRWGYYLGTGVMNADELKIAFNALASQAIYQGDPRIRQIYRQLSRRIKGFELNSNANFFYPVRQHLNRAINYTDPQEMMEKGQHRHTLFHQLDKVENAIITGQAIEISRHSDPYGNQRLGILMVWPLQLIYYDIAWYLLYESCQDGCLAIGRVNRFKDFCHILTPQGRGIEAQKQSLKNAYKLFNNGWGLKLGDLEEQQAELSGKLNFIAIKVRFYPPVSYFIEEGELRHPHQKLRRGNKDPKTGKPLYVDYLIKLPPRSLDEFSIWLQRYMDKVQVISPPELLQKHYQAALALVELYQD